MASSGDLRSLLGPAIFSAIPNNAQVVLQQAWTSHMDTLKGQLEKVKVDAEQKIAELTSTNNELGSKLAVYTEETERGQSALQIYREQVKPKDNILVAHKVFERMFSMLTGCGQWGDCGQADHGAESGQHGEGRPEAAGVHRQGGA